MAHAAARKLLDEESHAVAQRHPRLSVSTSAVEGKAVDVIADAAEGHSLVVLGTHHGSNLSAALGAATGLRVSVSSLVPTAVVPANWSVENAGRGIMVGIDPDGASMRALDFAVGEAHAACQPLELVSVWGLPPLLSKPAEAMGGGLAPVGEQWQRDLDEQAAQLAQRYPGLHASGRSIESSSPASGLIEHSLGCSLLVLGTHSRNALGRALFGSVTHGVLMGAAIPVVIVPK
jgi:nucleotide-binding universal stress UspA family protein